MVLVDITLQKVSAQHKGISKKHFSLFGRKQMIQSLGHKGKLILNLLFQYHRLTEPMDKGAEVGSDRKSFLFNLFKQTVTGKEGQLLGKA
jgi:hypothetical protein